MAASRRYAGAGWASRVCWWYRFVDGIDGAKVAGARGLLSELSARYF